MHCSGPLNVPWCCEVVPGDGMESRCGDEVEWMPDTVNLSPMERVQRGLIAVTVVLRLSVSSGLGRLSECRMR